MLGNAEGVFSCGELRRFTLHGGISMLEEQSKDSIQFWTKISRGLEKKLGKQNTVDCEELCHGVEYHTRFFAPWQLRPKRMKSYARYANALMDLVFEESGANWIVDSSKYPGRLLALLKVSKYPVSVVYLTRHPVGVIQSFSRKDVEQPEKGFLAANYYYGVNGFLCSMAFHWVPASRRVKIRYENLIRSPESLLSEIGKKLGMNLEIPISIASARGLFEVGYLVDGNRIRTQKDIRLQSTEHELSWDMRSIVTRILNRIWY